MRNGEQTFLMKISQAGPEGCLSGIPMITDLLVILWGNDMPPQAAVEKP